MRYVSTRGEAPSVGFIEAILAGLAPDGGLYLPETWPRALDNPAFRREAGMAPFAETAARVLQAFAGDALSADETQRLTHSAYAHAGWPPATTPLVQMGPGRFCLELFHGPSLSFKDVAMQLIGPLYDLALRRVGRRLSVVCATSGDTGGAAVEALKGLDSVDLFILMPKARVSDVQRLFMSASGAANVHALEVEGDFDACQALVKGLFADRDFAERASLSGVNSINWARIVAQSVYYHVAANTLSALGPVNFVVPTGNFGDAFAGYAAKACGAPIGRIGLGVNANDIIARALETGRYARAARSHATLSPAMDIQVASNFERILYEALGRDGETVRALYARFQQGDAFDIPAPGLAWLRRAFAAAAVSDVETEAAMRDAFAGGMMICPHTAVGVHAADRMAIAAPLVCLATAHPAKFPETVAAAIGAHPALPRHCADLFSRRETLHEIANDLSSVRGFIRAHSRAWS